MKLLLGMGILVILLAGAVLALVIVTVLALALMEAVLAMVVRLLLTLDQEAVDMIHGREAREVMAQAVLVS